MASIYLQCCGALALLSGALGFRMSMYRLAGSPGDDKPNSPLNQWWLSQTLCAEWNPVVWGLLLALHARGDSSQLAQAFALALTASRFAFASKPLLPSKIVYPISFASMVTTYTSVFVLGAKLVWSF